MREAAGYLYTGVGHYYRELRPLHVEMEHAPTKLMQINKIDYAKFHIKVYSGQLYQYNELMD